MRYRDLLETTRTIGRGSGRFLVFEIIPAFSVLLQMLLNVGRVFLIAVEYSGVNMLGLYKLSDFEEMSFNNKSSYCKETYNITDTPTVRQLYQVF